MNTDPKDTPMLPDDAATLVSVVQKEGATQTESDALPPEWATTWEPAAKPLNIPDARQACLPDIGQLLDLKPGELCTRSMQALRKQFKSKEYETNPSEPEWEGLEQITLAIEGMAEGTLKPEFHISSLSCGVGKTSAVCCAVSEMMKLKNKYKDTSVIIFLSRCEEIKSLVKAMGLKDADFAVSVDKAGPYADRNDWGTGNPNTGRVLFTTQQRLRLYLQSRDTFADLEGFHFKGNVRQVRVWDEAILPANTLTLNAFEIARLLLGCIKRDKTIAEFLKIWTERLDYESGVIEFDPDKLIKALPLNTWLSWFGKDDQDIAATVHKLSGETVSVRIDQDKGNVVHYEDAFPADFAPLLILDASGLLRETYKQWFKSRGNLVPLFSPQKNFSRLQIRHWDHAAGRSGEPAYLNKIWEEVASGVALKIKELEGDVLVVHFLPSPQVRDFAARIRQRTNNKPHVHFTTWGQHTATNDYRDCRHVILAGILQYGAHDIEALGRGARAMDPYAKFTDDDHTEIREGEAKHNILQAASRGATRQSDLNQCPEGCTLWAVFTSHPTTGLRRELLSEIFQGADVQGWLPLGGVERKKPRLLQAREHLELKKGEDVTVTELAAVLGDKGASNLLRKFKQPKWKVMIDQSGRVLIPGKRGGKSVAGRLVPVR